MKENLGNSPSYSVNARGTHWPGTQQGEDDLAHPKELRMGPLCLRVDDSESLGKDDDTDVSTWCG